MSRITIAGGTGFIGRHIAQALLARGDDVTILTRDPFEKRESLPAEAQVKSWDPTRAGEWVEHLEGCDALINTCGEVVVGRRYTAASKQRMRASRVGTTRVLVEAMGRLDPRPSVFLSASAIGYYGHAHGVEPLDENAPAGDDFLAQLCVEWEAAACEAEALGVRVVRARYGIVFGKDGGFLEPMALAFRCFVGGPIGSGAQVISWVHVDDAVAMTLKCLDDASISGAVNLTSPNAATNAEISHALGHVLGRPSWLRVPGAVLRLALGEGAVPMLGGQRAVPKRMQALGYEWAYTDVRRAVEAELG